MTSLSTQFRRNGNCKKGRWDCFLTFGLFGIGPVRFFAENDRYLFLKTVGRKRYSDRPENDFEGADSTKQFLFILDQSSEQVVGPLSVSEFEDRTSQQVSDLDWKRPRPIWPLFIMGLATIGLLVLICASAFVLRKMPTKVLHGERSPSNHPMVLLAPTKFFRMVALPLEM